MNTSKKACDWLSQLIDSMYLAAVRLAVRKQKRNRAELKMK